MDPVCRTLGLAVVIDGCAAFIFALRYGPDLRFHHFARRFEEMALDLVEGLPAILAEQCEQSPLSDDACPHLRLHVLADDVEPDVGEDQVPDILPQPAALHDLDRRDTQSLLPDLGRLRVVTALHRTADVRLVPLGGRPADKLRLVEDRLEDRHVVELVAQRKDVVVNDDVAFMKIFAEVLPDVLADRSEGERQDRQVFGLLQHPALRVVQAGDEVLRLAEDRRAGSPLQRDRHLVRYRLEGPREDARQDGVDHDAPPLRAAGNACCLFLS